MRILIVSQYFWPESFRINDLALALCERGHEVSVLTGLPNYPHGKFDPGYGFTGPWSDLLGPVPIKRVPLSPRGSGKGWMLGLNFATFALFGSVLGPLRVRYPIDMIFVYEPSPVTSVLPGVVLSKRRSVPLVLWAQDLWPDVLSATGAVHSQGVLSQISKLTRWIYRRCDRILAESKAFVPSLEGSGVPAEKIDYVPNWAEAHYKPMLLPDDVPERKEIPPGFCIMFAGNLGESQSLETIVAAASALRDQGINWVILGEGRRQDWLRREVKARGLGDVVHLLGRRPVESMPTYFALADALLLTLKADTLYTLTVPSKLQSYMACGKPILGAIDGEGSRIIVESQGGVVAAAENPDGLAEAALKLFHASPAEREEMGRRSREYFEQNFERELVIDRLEGILVETASSYKVVEESPGR